MAAIEIDKEGVSLLIWPHGKKKGKHINNPMWMTSIINYS